MFCNTISLKVNVWTKYYIAYLDGKAFVVVSILKPHSSISLQSAVYSIKTFDAELFHRN
jgi:hypothetical protein